MVHNGSQSHIETVETVISSRSPVLHPGPMPDFEGPGRVRAESFGSSGASSPPEQVNPGSLGICKASHIKYGYSVSDSFITVSYSFYELS